MRQGSARGQRLRRVGVASVVLSALVATPFVASTALPADQGTTDLADPSGTRGYGPFSSLADAPDAGDDILAAVHAARAAERLAMAQATDGAVRRLRRSISVSSPKGTRVWSPSAMSDHGLPAAAERAYRRAAGQAAPGCLIPWTLLAGVGRVESDHGRYGGSELGADAVSRPEIIGIRLDGRGPVAAIRDTDRGRLDGDKVWDRAVGPMQFIPATWQYSARDGDGDGRKNPHDLDDAAASAAAYLCSGSGNLADPGTQAAAIYRYNQDDYYVALVQAFERGYRTGVFVMPAPPLTEEELEQRRAERRAERAAERAAERRTLLRERRVSRREAVRERRRGTRADTGPAPEPAPAPRPAAEKPAPSSKPAPAPRPEPVPSSKPAPAPPPPSPTKVTGVFGECAGGYCLGGAALDLSGAGDLGAPAPGDLDGDTTVEPLAEELAGLLGTQVTAVVVKGGDGVLTVLAVNGFQLS